MMASTQRSSRRGLVWAVVGGAVLLVALLAVVLVPLFSQNAEPALTGSSSPAAKATPSATAASPDEQFVDSSAADKGWVPEPITTDRDRYVRAALTAASTFDTQLSTRAEWLDYLDTWFTPDTRYTTEADREDDMRASQLELRQGVVLPESEWDSLANEDGRVEADVDGDIEYTEVPGDTSGDMKIGTADVVLTYTRSDESGEETSYDEPVRVSVQVLCGSASVPTADSAQQAGDCKVVRYFSGQVEP
ncbi:MAG: hypothetical protein ACTHNQ_19325 [Microbacterium sp.]|uniref:hypothetical protein n=1 Tax=Microbacterium sp. TaxID=51671 RepID=UPI003F814913